MQTLKEIWKQHAGVTSDKDTSHSYIDVYEKLFAPYRNGPTRLLEIGVGWGDCLVGWKHYFPNGEIVGLDHDPHHAVSRIGTGFRVVKGDSRCVDVQKLFPNEMFDIIIDDGDHSIDAQVKTFGVFRELVKPGGIYIVEDIERIENAPRLGFADLGFEILDLRDQRDGRVDNIMAIWRPTN